MTLMEIMVVVLLLALMATAVAVSLLKVLEQAKDREVASEVHTVGVAVKTWLLEHEGCPTIEELPLDRDVRLRDPWDGAFVITCDPEGPVVTSPGRDGRMQTEDDVSTRRR